MKRIEEKNINNKSVYYIENKISPLIINYPPNIPRAKFALLLNSSPIDEFDNYINNTIAQKSYATRRKQALALFLFYTFLFYTECDMRSLSEDDIHNLVYFLSGKSEKLENASLLTKRSAASITNLLSAIRSFLSSININNEFLGYSSSKKSASAITKFVKRELEDPFTYGQNLTDYVTQDQFDCLISLTKKNRDFTAEVIMRMLYDYGFRLREILGICLEDLTEIQNAPDSYEYFIILRDRTTDKSFQRYNKSRNNNTHKNEQRNRRELSIPINIELFGMIHRYLNHTESIRKFEYCKAESLTKKHLINYYIFLSKNGHTLSSEMWSKKLKEYFIEAKIISSSESSSNNLSNKLRRSYIYRRIEQLKGEGESFDQIKRILCFELRYSNPYYLDSFFKSCGKNTTLH